MESRILPVAEWPRLVGTEAESIWPSLDPERTRIVVVEREGEIVGCHVLTWVLHAECLWTADAARGRGGVARRLWATVQRTIREMGASGVVTSALDERVKGLLAHVGAIPLPGDHFVIALKGRA